MLKKINNNSFSKNFIYSIVIFFPIIITMKSLVLNMFTILLSLTYVIFFFDDLKKKLFNFDIINFVLIFLFYIFINTIINYQNFEIVLKSLGNFRYILISLSVFFVLQQLSSQKKKQIVIGIAGSGENKKWNLEKYSELIQKLSKKYIGYKFIILGGKDQNKDYEIIKNNCDNTINIESFCNYNLQEIIKAISGSEIYIGNDTGFMHVCAFLKIPSYGIFGDSPSDYSNYHFLIHPILPTGYKEVNYNDKLMDSITADLVLSKINFKNDN